MTDQYIWLMWSSAFLIPWILLFARFRAHRRTMLWASVFTTPFGLTEPLFVPEYWNPPSLFDLAQRTGFDVESLIFCFGIGGVGAVLYNVLTRQSLTPLGRAERRKRLHRFHYWALAAPFPTFAVLLPLAWNPIYPGIMAMAVGTVAAILCRPDLKTKSWIGGLLFLGYYVVFLVGLEVTAPGYIQRVWNLAALSGVSLAGLPIEELLFAAGFGAYWSGVYEHFTWGRTDGGSRTPFHRALAFASRESH